MGLEGNSKDRAWAVMKMYDADELGERMGAKKKGGWLLIYFFNLRVFLDLHIFMRILQKKKTLVCH